MEIRQPHAVTDLASRNLKGEKIIKILGLSPRDTPWKILEIGTGSGGIASYLGSHTEVPCDVTSVDVLDLRLTRDHYKFFQVDGTTLPFEDASFEIVISNHVIEHVGVHDDQLKHLEECRRVLASSGVGYLAVPNRWMLTEPHYQLAFLSWLPRGLRSHYLKLRGKGDFYDCEPLSLGELERLFRFAKLDASNASIEALKLLLEIEHPGGWLIRKIGDLPEGLLKMLRPTMPTLVYTFRKASI